MVYAVAMRTSDLIAAAGNKTQLAQILGIKRQAVQSWGETVPELQQYRIKELRPRWFRKGGPMNQPERQPAPASDAEARA